MSTEGAVTLSMTLSEWEALSGAVRVLERGGKRLEVTIPAGTKPGQTIRLRNALRVTDGREGDILIAVRVSTSQGQGGVMVVTDATFESEVLKSQLPVVVDFWAPWCGPCRVLAPITEKLSAEFAGRVKFCKVNVDENRLASQRYQVMSIPKVLIFKGGTIADVSVGAAPENELRRRIERVLQAGSCGHPRQRER